MISKYTTYKNTFSETGINVKMNNYPVIFKKNKQNIIKIYFSPQYLVTVIYLQGFSGMFKFVTPRKLQVMVSFPI